MNKIITGLMCATLAASCSTKAVLDSSVTAEAVQPKNIIMIVGDGMGPAYTTAYRYFKDDVTTENVENTVFDRHLVGLSSTYPHLDSNYVTDSAASATALSSGIKTYNGAIGVNVNKAPVESVLAYAKQIGKKTGIVVTSQINHATPAAYLAHNESRQNYDQIADSYLDKGILADVYLGGGWKYFIRDDRNLVEEFKQQGFHYVDDYNKLNVTPENKPLFGLFAKKGLPWSLDDTNKHRLSALTQTAITHLENDKGFFMLIEASQIDWAGHSNDIASAMAEMDDLAKTVELLELYVKNHPDTLVVLTADHSTGGLTIGAKGVYEWRPEIIKHMTQSTDKIAKAFAKNDLSRKEVNQRLNFALTVEEYAQLQTLKETTLAEIERFKTLPKSQKKYSPNLKRKLYKALNKIVDQRTNTGWTSTGHTAIDVPVFALGKGSELFHGYQDNTDIAKKIFSLLGKKH